MQTRCFSIFGPETREEIKLEKHQIRFELERSKAKSDARLKTSRKIRQFD